MFKIPLFGLSSVFYTSCTKKEPYLFIGKTHKFKNCLNLMTLNRDYNLVSFFDCMSRRTELFDLVRISNISFHNNSVHEHTIKVHKNINNLKSLKFEDYFMRNH